jgi:hypothetical protein
MPEHALKHGCVHGLKTTNVVAASPESATWKPSTIGGFA